MSADTTEAFAISLHQELVWRDAESRGGKAVPVTAVVEVRGPLDPERLRAAARTVAERHEILRTELRVLDGFVTPAQVIHSEPVDVEAAAGSAWSGEPVVGAAPLTLTVTRVDADQHVLELRAPAAILDRAGAVVLVDEIAAAYAGADASEEDPLQYADLAEWLRERISDGRFEEPRFLREVADDATALRLPFALSARNNKDTAALELGDILPPDASRLLADGDVRDVVLAAWLVVLHRYTGAARPLIALADGGRATPELAGAIGPLTRLVPLTGSFDTDTSFRDVVRRSRAAFEGAEAEAELFDPAWWSSRDADGVVAFEHVDLGAPRSAGDVVLTPVAVHGAHPGTGLTLLVAGTGATTATATLVYDPATYAATDLAQVGTVLRTVLAHAAADPGALVGELPVWPHHEVIGAPRTGPADLVPVRFAAHVARDAEATAVEDATTVLTYRQLDEFADRLAARLAAHHVGPGSIVPVLLDRGATTIGAMLGVWRTGAAFTVLDDTAPPGRISAVLADTAAGVVVTSAALADRLADHSAAHVLIDDLPAAAPESRIEPGPESLAYVVYTSGSTGTPRGVAVSHRALAAYVDEVGRRLPGSQGSAFAAITTFAADLGYTAVFSALASGGRLSVVPRSAATSPAELAVWMTDHRIDCLKIVPSHLAALLNAAEDPVRVLPRRLLVVGGEALPVDLVKRVAELAPECVVVNHYGPTESTVGVCTFPAGTATLDPRAKTVPIGAPLPGVQAAVWAGVGQSVPDWMPGELYVAGDQLAEGYLHQPEQTAERFRTAAAEPGSPEVRWYRTGDVVRTLPGGEIEYLGRADHQVKINGYRVEPQEIEAVLRAHARVSEVVVAIAGPDQVLTAYLVAEGDAPTADELGAHVRTALPEYMVPKVFAVLPALPRTANGKIDRAELLALDTSAGRASAAVPPRDSLELRILQIWQETLGSDTFGVTDDFFDVGGHSLAALQLLAAVSRTVGARLPISILFEDGTVAGLARAVRAQSEWQSAVLVPMRPGGSRPPVFCVHAGGGSVMGYLDLVAALPDGIPVYGVEAVGLDGHRPPLGHVTEMVDLYAAEIERLGGDAPSTIVGWGLGAVFAFALAERLRALGRPVAKLVIVDGAAPDTRALRAVIDGTSEDDYYRGMTETEIVERFAAHYGLPISAEDLDGRTDEEKLVLLATAIRERDGADHFEVLFELYRSNIAACQEYVLGFRPEFADYDVLLFRAIEESSAEPGHDETALGWRTLFGDRVTQVSVPGDHYSVMKPPVVGDLGASVDKAIEGII
ncbi:non-ribosomal peptide synthetase [Actinoplanes sp. HUAS TT8]|uniref:non-ribosomal peptide synthetase n=1 Tax=Actinoplanes sp. HUAS TT8 TaxID=3447453 RepID=UPI003F51FAF4